LNFTRFSQEQSRFFDVLVHVIGGFDPRFALALRIPSTSLLISASADWARIRGERQGGQKPEGDSFADSFVFMRLVVSGVLTAAKLKPPCYEPVADLLRFCYEPVSALLQLCDEAQLENILCVSKSFTDGISISIFHLPSSTLVRRSIFFNTFLPMFTRFSTE
jgi:hypothetical protein